MAYAADRCDNPNYVVLKGGLYSPNEKSDLNNLNAGNTIPIDAKTGFDGELAVGHYLLHDWQEQRQGIIPSSAPDRG